MAKCGRPPKLQEPDIQLLVKEFEKYIANTDIPIIAEFAYQHGVLREYLYDRQEFSTLIKICVAKKETNLERKSLDGEVNPSVAIFSLKQLGWRDRQEIDLDSKVTLKVSDDI